MREKQIQPRKTAVCSAPAPGFVCVHPRPGARRLQQKQLVPG